MASAGPRESRWAFPCYLPATMGRYLLAGVALISWVSGATPSTATEDTGDTEGIFWSDQRGILFPLDAAGDELDLVRLGQLRERYEEGIELLDEGRWEEAVEAFEEVAEEVPVPDVLLGAAMGHYQLEQYSRAHQLLELTLQGAPDDIRVVNLMGLVLGALGYPENAREYLVLCGDLARESENRAFEAYALLNLSQVELDLGNPTRADELAGQALSIGKQKRYGNVIAAAQNSQGNVALYLGRYKDAEKLYRKCLQVEKQGRGNDDKGAVLNNLANVLASRGKLDKAHELLDQALAHSTKSGHRTQEASVLITMAGLEHQMGAKDVAAAHLEDALTIFRHLNLDRGSVEVRLQQARHARSDGRITEALEFIELARIADRELALPQTDAELQYLECEVLLDQGDPPAAARAADQARVWFAQAGQALQEAGALLCWAEATALTGQSQPANDAFVVAMGSLESLDDEARVADASQRYGMFLLREGQVEEGGRQIRRALDWLHEQDRTKDLAQALHLAGYVLAEREHNTEALAYFDECATVACELDDADLLAKLLANRVNLLIRLGRPEDARRIAGADPSPELEQILAIATARQSFDEGLAAMDAEDWPTARQWMQQVLDEAPGDDKTLRPSAHTNLRMIEHHTGLGALSSGELPEAMAHLAAALEHVSFEENPAAEARLLKDLGVVRMELEDPEQALRYLEQAIVAAEIAKDQQLLRSIHFQTGLAALDSDPARARNELEAAQALAPENVDELAAAGFCNLGILLYRLEEHADAKEALIRSKEIYQQLGASEQVAQIDTYLEDFPDQE